MANLSERELEAQRIKAACDFISEIADKLCARPDIIVNRYYKAGFLDGRNWRCGNVDGHPGQSFAYTVDERHHKCGFAYDFAQKTSWDSLQIVKHREGLDTMYKAAQFAAQSLLGLPAQPLPMNGEGSHGRQGGDVNRTPEERIAAAKGTYYRAKDFRGTLGEKYLRDVRGIVLDATYGLRFSPTTMVRVTGEETPRKLPALLVPSCDEHGNMTAVGKFFLTEDGKLNRSLLGRSAKKVAGVNKGRAVPLNGSVKNIWFVTEGFEDCATAKMYMPKLTGRGILGVSVIDELFVPNTGVDVLIVFEDNDGKKSDEKGGGHEGRLGRQRLYARLNTEVKQGLRAPLKMVTVKTPKPYKDINQMHLQCDPEVVADFLRRQLARFMDPDLITIPTKPASLIVE